MEHAEFVLQLHTLLQKNPATTSPAESYLRRLLFQVQQNQTQPPSLKLFLQIFHDALQGPEAPFNQDWSGISEPPFFYEEENPRLKPLEFTLNSIRFHVADLRRMADNELKNPYRGLGITSPSGASWYNFEIMDKAEAYHAFMQGGEPTEEEDPVTWDEIGYFLLIGKGYE